MLNLRTHGPRILLVPRQKCKKIEEVTSGAVY
jgi:hypothetical protein